MINARMSTPPFPGEARSPVGPWWVSEFARRQRPPTNPANPRPAGSASFKISLAEWSLHKSLFAKKIDSLDFPKIARDELRDRRRRVREISFPKTKPTTRIISRTSRSGNDVGVTCVLIMIDGEGDIDAGEARSSKHEAVENHKMVGRRTRPALGFATPIRINTGGHYSPADVAAVAESHADCSPTTAHEKRHLDLSARITAGLRGNPDALIALMKADR